VGGFAIWLFFFRVYWKKKKTKLPPKMTAGWCRLAPHQLSYPPKTQFPELEPGAITSTGVEGNSNPLLRLFPQRVYIYISLHFLQRPGEWCFSVLWWRTFVIHASTTTEIVEKVEQPRNSPSREACVCQCRLKGCARGWTPPTSCHDSPSFPLLSSFSLFFRRRNW